MPTRKIQLAKVSNDEIKSTMLFLNFMEQIHELDLTDYDFDIDDFFEPEMATLFRSFLDEDKNFQYDIFFAEVGKVLGFRFKLIVIGYQTMVENFCKPDSPVLESLDNLMVYEEGDLCVRAEEVCEFTHFQMWINKAASWIGSFGPNEKVICVDKNGNVLNNGQDFQHARDNNSFPIKAYRLVRNTEEKIIKSVSNN